MCPLRDLHLRRRSGWVIPHNVEKKVRMSSSPMQQLASALRQNGLIRFIEHFAELFPTTHMKDLVVDRIGPQSDHRGGRQEGRQLRLR